MTLSANCRARGSESVCPRLSKVLMKSCFNPTVHVGMLTHVGDVIRQQGVDVVAGILRGDFVGAAIARGRAATGLALGEYDLDASFIQ